MYFGSRDMPVRLLRQEMAKEQPLLPGSWWVVGCSFRYLAIFLLSILFSIAFYCNREGRLFQRRLESFSSVQIHGVLASNCNLFAGTWVYDNKSLPLYKDSNCSFMFDDLACEKYGRKDLDYQYWRWQPDNCDLPKFGAKALLDKLRDKRLVFVGDSLNRNQWVSLVCLIESSIPSSLMKSRSLKGSLYSFNAKEYNATIDFYWAPLLVESNSDDPSNHHLSDRAVRVESIAKHAKHWADADILIFNSYLWWKVATMKVFQESLENSTAVYKEMESRKCYEMALKTWSKWVLGNVDGNKTRLFWMSMSPPHTLSSNWGRPHDELKCYNETQPITKEELRGSESDPEMMRSTERAVESLHGRGVKIDLLNITGLTEYRKDGHPTVYRKQWRPLTQEQLANPLTYADCTHWCLPGVPDVWNHLLYTYLV
ncbi:protein trichome birefringence-like 34 [Coffea arabica]|uniref:Protein trichome birefringence-like 34 n=1 Tax=Coffea arabica TaxID=13443 RepID=A0A6P6SUA3_COFAR|nr:protein trichome birefringence-like 34 [Coffea arabica]